MSDEEYIDNENWLDMRVGDTGTMFAVLESVGYGNPGTLMVRFSDWSDQVVDVAQPRAAASFKSGAHVLIRVRRTEDGLEGLAMWEIGGPPAPLTSGSK